MSEHEVRCDGSCEDCCGAIPGEDNCYRPLIDASGDYIEEAR